MPAVRRHAPQGPVMQAQLRTAEPTDTELQDVWQAMRRPTWPATYAEAMADPLLSRLVKLTARHPPKAGRKGRAVPMEPPACGRAIPQHQPLPARFDCKRAAAGDRDDD